MWKPILAVLALSSCVLFSAEKTVITVDADSDDGALYNFWSTTVTTSQRRFLTNSEHARIQRESPFAKYINCVRLLGGRSDGENQFFKGVGPDGEALCDFTEAREMLRGIVRCGYTPRIVLDNVPIEMSQPEQLHKYGNTLPPKDFNVWHSYVRQFTEMLVKEFGRNEVKRWRFRVGTEPDLNPGHWSGTEKEYYQHYDYTVDAVTSVIPEADIGPGNILNPAKAPAASKKGFWGLNIIDHCATGTNYKTGKIGTRLCFFGITWYGQVGKGVDTFDIAVDRVRERLARYPQFAKLPVEVHEFSVLKDEKGQTLYGGDATEWAASWMVAVAQKVYQNRVAQVFQWNTTSIGLPNPRTHVFSLLEKMQDGQRLATQSPAPGEIGCLAGKKNGGLDLLIFQHQAKRATQPVADVELMIAGKWLSGKKWRIQQANVIDADHSGYIRAYHADIKEAGIATLPKVGEFAASPIWHFGEEGRELMAIKREKYVKLGQLASLQPLPTLKQNGKNTSLSLRMTPQSVVYIRLEQSKQSP